MSAYKCACIGCEEEAFWKPALVMTEEEQEKVGGKARVEISITFCSRHRRTVSVMDILTDESWEQMSNAFGCAGKEMPERGNIELDFCHVHYGYCN